MGDTRRINQVSQHEDNPRQKSKAPDLHSHSHGSHVKNTSRVAVADAHQSTDRKHESNSLMIDATNAELAISLYNDLLHTLNVYQIPVKEHPVVDS